MSCTCLNKTEEGKKFVCTCDEFTHPPALNIGAGLTDLPRQIAGFPEFRRAMLRSVGMKEELAGWRAGDKSNLGLMLIEMWAYVCDSLSFYDKVIAQECYINTSSLRSSLRKLIALLGYLPAPAVGSSVKLVASADGRSPLSIPAGTVFRSAGFSGNPPQVFELDTQTFIHPFRNKWTITAVRPGTILHANPHWLLIEPKAEIKPFSRLLLLDYSDASQNQALKVISAKPYTGTDGKRYTKLVFQSPAKLAAGTPLSRLWLLMPDSNSILWHVGSVLESSNSETINALKKNIELFGIVQEYNWNFANPDLPAEVRAEFSTNIDKPDADPVQLALRYGVPSTGTIVNEPQQTLSASDTLVFDKRAEAPPDKYDTGDVALVDKDLRGVIVNGKIDYQEPALNPGMNQSWQPALRTPVDIYGNLLTASRGETVRNEVLGSGNAAAATQSFKLAKKPLTYFIAPSAGNDRGVKNSLRVYVNGVKWKEVASFYGIAPDEEVYIVRQDDSGESYVIFGNGIRGKRLPSGSANVIAYYRFGAEQACPPPGAITQIQTTVPGLAGINNPVPASGGADAENKESLRSNAPRSALLLGRAVSIQDMEAASLATPGVRTVQAGWHWHATKQCPVVYIWYIGSAGIGDLLENRLKAISDPSTPIAAEQAMPVRVSVSIDIETNSRYIEKDVLAEVRKVLATPGTGLLSPEQLGVGKPLFRSKIFEQVIGVAGVVAIHNIVWNGAVLNDYAKKPPTGMYFDFENGEIILNGNQ